MKFLLIMFNKIMFKLPEYFYYWKLNKTYPQFEKFRNIKYHQRIPSYNIDVLTNSRLMKFTRQTRKNQTSYQIITGSAKNK